MTYILGLNAFHADSSAALIKDGNIIAAVEEERFRRLKHWAGFPSKSIAWCLKDANIKLSDINHVAINTKPKAHLLRKLIYTIKKKPDPKFLIKRFKNKRERTDIKTYFKSFFPNNYLKAKIHYIEHHKAHLASAFYASNFKKAAVLSVDGFGDFASCAWGIGENKDLSVDGQIFFPHSLGAFYTTITQFLGFPNYGDEYKVMGLAPYGRASYMNEMREILKIKSDGSFELNLKYFNHPKGNVAHQWDNGIPILDNHFSGSLIDLLGPKRVQGAQIEKKDMDIAASAQSIYEEALFNMISSLYEKYSIKKICLAGGCGNNSVANGKITRNTPFKNLYVQAAAGDAGGALGSALSVWNNLDFERSTRMSSAYLGPCSNEKEIHKLINNKKVKTKLNKLDCKIYKIGDSKFKNEKQFLNHIVNEICNGSIIGWFQGRMEWGPRALGNRSILGDPRRNDMKKILNKKIKKRESFRPFAPSILKEEIDKWFVLNDISDIEVPYMMKVYPIKFEKKELIPAVCHVDGTGRLQTVTEEENGRYYRLIKLFHEVTNIPILLNTSFNENEPIVTYPNEALDCFLRTKMDILVLDDFVIQRN